MGQPYVGEIRMFAGNFAPVGWQFCDGSLLAIAENETLFNLIGTTYGGDGQNTFAVPDLRGRIPIHYGNGVPLAQMGGSEEVTLTIAQIPSHNHPWLASSAASTAKTPGGNVPATAQGDLYTGSFSPVAMSPQSLGSAGGSQGHSNMQPYLCLNFIISLYGIFPSPS